MSSICTTLTLMVLIKWRATEDTSKRKQKQIPGIYSIFFLGKSLIGPIQVNCFGMGYSRRKNQTGWGRRVETYSFFEKPLDLFSFFSVSLEISGKAKLNLWKFGKIIYVTSLGNFKAKKRLWKAAPLETSGNYT